MGLKSPERPAKRTTSVCVTVRRGLSHSSPTTKSSNDQTVQECRDTLVGILHPLLVRDPAMIGIEIRVSDRIVTTEAQPSRSFGRSRLEPPQESSLPRQDRRMRTDPRMPPPRLPEGRESAFRPNGIGFACFF